MSKLPKAVQQQAAEADKLLAEMAPQPPVEGETPPAGETPPVVTPPAEGTPPEGETPPVEGETPPVETPPVVTPPVDTWEQRYNTLQGKYDAEIPRMAQSMSDLKAEIKYLKGKLESAEKFIAQPAVKDPTPPPTNPKLEEFKKDYPDIYDYVQEIVKNQTPPASPQMEEQVKRLTEVTQQSAADRFYDSLTTAVPDWVATNKDPKFAEWLQIEDPYTGLTKYELLAGAYQNMNAKVVSNFFKDYKKTLEPENPPATTPPPATPAPGTGKTVVDKGKYVAPATVKGSAPPAGTSQSTTIYPKSEIDNFYKQSALGRLRLTPEQKQAKEMEYWKAASESRVDYSR